MARTAAIGPRPVAASNRRGPVLWLILCGVVLIAGIVIGTAIMVDQFRERALNNAERELEDTALVLSRHFDQQFEDSDIIANDLLSKIQLSANASPESFKAQLSSLDAHLMLTSRASALSRIGEINIFDSDGKLINSSGPWPLPAASIADQGYFKTFKSDPRSGIALVELARSEVTGNLITVFAHRLSGPNGVFLGVMARRINAVHFEKFLASVALERGSAIAMLYRDGTMLARYPHADLMTGKKSRGPRC